MTSVHRLQLYELQLFWEGFPQRLGVFIGIFDHSSRSAFVRSHTDVGQEGLALSLRCNSPQRCSIGLRSGLCAGQSSSSTPNSLIHTDLALCTGAQLCWNRKGPSPNCSHKVGSVELSNIFGNGRDWNTWFHGWGNTFVNIVYLGMRETWSQSMRIRREHKPPTTKLMH